MMATYLLVETGELKNGIVMHQIAYRLQGVIKWAVILILFFTSCTTGEDKIGLTEQICQNLLNSHLLDTCTPDVLPTYQFFERTFPIGEVNLHYIETAMSGFEITFSHDSHGVTICKRREYKVGAKIVEFMICDDTLKGIYYSDVWW